mgnify:CR=1 FL=1
MGRVRGPEQIAVRSFNGAASVGTRKLPTNASEAFARPPLQWGRVCWDAEIRDLRRRIVEVQTASMGPRLLGRGNSSHTTAIV